MARMSDGGERPLWRDTGRLRAPTSPPPGRAFISSDGTQYVPQILRCRFCLNSEPLGFSQRLDGESRLGRDRIITEHYFRLP